MWCGSRSTRQSTRKTSQTWPTSSDTIEAAFPYLADGAVVLCSSQLPVGTTRKLERRWMNAAAGRTVSFACSPENLRLGKAIEVFTKPDRVVVGVRDDRARAKVQALLAPIADRIEWMSVESAEMTKHAVNAFLATSVAFINELAALCERAGADAKEVERGLRTERRIGPHAYLSPGGAFAGGTLARDVSFLRELGAASRHADAADGRRPGEQPGAPACGLGASWRRNWARLRDRRIAVWGLTYKPGTDTLRRSPAVELCRLAGRPGRRSSRPRPGGPDAARRARSITRHAEPIDAAAARARWSSPPNGPSIAQIDVDRLAAKAPGLVVLDANRFLAPLSARPAAISQFDYAAVGQPPERDERAQLARTRRRRRSAVGQSRDLGPGRSPQRHHRRRGLASVNACARAASQRALRAQARRGGRGICRSGRSAGRGGAGRCLERGGRQGARRAGLHHVSSSPHPREQRGYLWPLGTSETVDWDAWVRAMEINVYGSVLPCRALVPHFKPHHYGKIIQISGGGATNPLPRISAYAASKAAIVRFVESLALEVSQYKIDVNAIAPGLLNTRLLDEVLAAGPDAVGPDFHQRMTAGQGAGRNAARARRRACRLPGICGERRHHGPLAERGMGSLGGSRQPSR